MVSLLEVFSASVCLHSLLFLSLCRVSLSSEYVTDCNMSSWPPSPVSIQLTDEGSYLFQFSTNISQYITVQSENYELRFFIEGDSERYMVERCKIGLMVNDSIVNVSMCRLAIRSGTELFPTVLGSTSCNGSYTNGSHIDLTLGEQAVDVLTVPFIRKICNNNITICYQYCNNSTPFSAVENRTDNSGGNSDGGSDNEETPDSSSSWGPSEGSRGGSRQGPGRGSRGGSSRGSSGGPGQTSNQSSKRRRCSRLSNNIGDSLSNSQWLEDFCNCSYIRGLECTNPDNFMHCVNFCSPWRPFCDEFEVFNDDFCEQFCTDVIRSCDKENIALERPEAKGCIGMCYNPLQSYFSSSCVQMLIKTCESMLERSLPTLCNLTVPPQDLNSIINDYFGITFSLLQYQQTNVTLDILKDFFITTESFNLRDCIPRIVAAIDNRTIEAFSDIVDELLVDVRSQDFEELNITVGRNSSQEDLLEIIEDFSTLLTQLALNRTQPFVTRRNNFILLAENINITNSQESYVRGEVGVELTIPLSQLISNCSGVVYDEDCVAAVSVAIVNNLARYLDVVSQTNNNDTTVRSNAELVTVNIYTQKDNEISELQDFSDGEPILISLRPIEPFDLPLHDCVSWNFNVRNWSTDGIETRTNPLANTVVCEISHFTSFSILVSPTEHESSISGAEKTALNVITYIGCLVSIISLILTILFFISFRKVLNKGSLLYVHLNLAFALLIALILFVSTVDVAHKIYTMCVVTTTLLHYFLLCSFCWMLAEGIMLYLMVVRVFGTAADKWYWLLPLGWGLPVPVVVTSAGVLEGKYNDYIEDKYCWLNAGNGAAAIWTFIVPMTIIIMVNLFILVRAIHSVVKVKKHGGAEYNMKHIELAKTAVKGTIIFLPLMGITWIIGIFAVNQNTTVFAWLFTIFNSLQGTAFFILHVLRNDTIQSKFTEVVKSFCCCHRKHKVTPENSGKDTKSSGMNGSMDITTSDSSDTVE